MVLGDRVAGAVGASHPEVGLAATSPGTVTSAQVRGVAEQDQVLVTEPVSSRSYDTEAVRRDVVDATIPTEDIFKN